VNRKEQKKKKKESLPFQTHNIIYLIEKKGIPSYNAYESQECKLWKGKVISEKQQKKKLPRKRIIWFSPLRYPYKPSMKNKKIISTFPNTLMSVTDEN